MTPQLYTFNRGIALKLPDGTPVYTRQYTVAVQTFADALFQVFISPAVILVKIEF